MKKRILVGLAVVLTVGILSSCGRVPQSQIDTANVAIEAAKTAEAPVYLPVEFTAVQDSMNVIMTSVEAQKSKLFKKFGPIKEKLVVVTDQANQLATNAVTKKAEVKAQVETTITDVKSVLDENTKLIAKAPRGKEGRSVLTQMNDEMTVITEKVTNAQTLYDNGKYMDALNEINAAKESATGINTELKDAIAKVKR